MSPTTSRVLPLGPSGGVTDGAALFQRFLAEVARRSLAEWLPPQPCAVLDLSPQSPRLLGLMVERGHTVTHVQPLAHRIDIEPGAPVEGGSLRTVQADPRRLDWVDDGVVDLVVAEGGVLSGALAVELTIEDLFRVLRPGGRLLLCVDSLVAGLARLADQGRWAELADVPAADVVLVPGEDGAVSRCFWPEELHGILAAVGFAVEWIRPRTVLSEETITRALRLDPEQLHSLVDTELALAVRRQGESIGNRLVASARKP
jgi:SAM-dependent methyltransferase